jgi:hypothetical protein
MVNDRAVWHSAGGGERWRDDRRASAVCQGGVLVHRLLTAVGVVSLALFAGCSQPVSPTSPTSGAPGAPSTATAARSTTGTGEITGGLTIQEVPLKGRYEGSYTFTPDAAPSPFASVHLEATGNATHLGRFTLDFPHRVNLAAVPITGVGTAQLTGANGDTLISDSTGVATPLATPGAYTIVETHTIIGGTGRFAGATGTFIVTRAVDLANPLTSAVIEGTISSPGVGRR